MTKETTQGLRPWLKAVLVVSLALNLAVIGLGAGAAWRFKDGAHGAGHPPMLGRFIFKDLGRKEVRRLLQDRGGETGGVHDRRRGEMEQVIALLRAETLDAPAVMAVVEAHIVETDGFIRSVAQIWERRLEGMSLKQRRKLADRMQRQMEKGPHHRKGPGRD
ncbi:periplasmic heavy metal sensor [Pseudophaeobacter leonis]|uniref:periplasmic heavy metal sensor n=1 Tax=Pseudophaeobacter leonis TaxID=1144477 RepID=UPI0009F3E779|nr:periplasmic heavy metal sensor [Pseudophaeobacter leonis]